MCPLPGKIITAVIVLNLNVIITLILRMGILRCEAILYPLPYFWCSTHFYLILFMYSLIFPKESGLCVNLYLYLKVISLFVTARRLWNSYPLKKKKKLSPMTFLNPIDKVIYSPRHASLFKVCSIKSSVMFCILICGFAFECFLMFYYFYFILLLFGFNWCHCASLWLTHAVFIICNI